MFVHRNNNIFATVVCMYWTACLGADWSRARGSQWASSQTPPLLVDVNDTGKRQRFSQGQNLQHQRHHWSTQGAGSTFSCLLFHVPSDGFGSLVTSETNSFKKINHNANWAADDETGTNWGMTDMLMLCVLLERYILEVLSAYIATVQSIRALNDSNKEYASYGGAGALSWEAYKNGLNKSVMCSPKRIPL